MQLYGDINALSDFRIKKLLKQLKKVNDSITTVNAEYVHIVESEPLGTEHEEVLKKLLTYGDPFKGSKKGSLYFVIPRPGTISPWSSKATDIVHNSGLNKAKRVERGIAYYINGVEALDAEISPLLHDRMTEIVIADFDLAEQLFIEHEPKTYEEIDINKGGMEALIVTNKKMGLALNDNELEYLLSSFKKLGRNPTDVELMMYAQVNSEHTRHKVFNAQWTIDEKKQNKSLFKMIKNTYEKNSENVLSAYSDNAAVLRGPNAERFFVDPENDTYDFHNEPVHSVIKVETHNHPTAISPAPGAATGIGGEIRDEAATGRGAKSKMGLSGYSVSNLRIPEFIQPWEVNHGKPDRIASALDIMMEAPIGGAGFANEFGRPNLAGYFRTLEQEENGQVWGYHKPIMIAGGLGNIRDEHINKLRLPVGALIIVLGGPAMLIGLGGGAASSMESGKSDEHLDFASVQRGNGELERRAQEVIDRCWAKGSENPIITIHDVGAGGLSNALPELVHDSSRGALFELRNIPNAEPGLSPLEIWCNEAQERYVLGIEPKDLKIFEEFCKRERCPFAVIGKVTEEEQLILKDRLFNNIPIDLPLDLLLKSTPQNQINIKKQLSNHSKLNLEDIDIESAVQRVLKLPSVGSKKFLITIGDRTVGGLSVRDQMVGPWQVPVADAAVTASGFTTDYGEAMAMGEKTPLAIINPSAAARMAIAEAVTNIASADIKKLQDIKLSANWMAAVGYNNEDQSLYESVKSVGEAFCPELGLTIPVGKDSLSMRTTWEDKGTEKSVTSPLSVIITAFSPVNNVSRTLTPQLENKLDTSLILLIPAEDKCRLGGSSIAQVFNQIGNEVPDIKANNLKAFFEDISSLKSKNMILAYHDRSDGGLLTTVLEMAFASRCGVNLDISGLSGNPIEKLFNEELGAVIQVNKKDEAAIKKLFGESAVKIGSPTLEQKVNITDHGNIIYSNKRETLESWWSETSYMIQKLRDNPKTADEEFSLINNTNDNGLFAKTTINLKPGQFTKDPRPKIAIFREEGVNGQVEMAAAFNLAGFSSVDVHLNDLINGSKSLDDFVGLVACGGFSYGDVLGAGEGWAKSILFNDKLRNIFINYFVRPDTFSLGVCNGCQALAAMKELIPGTEKWPQFLKNTSEQFEARVVMTKINNSPSIFFKGMEGSSLPVPTAHGEGRASFIDNQDIAKLIKSNLIVAQYVDNNDKVTETYPYNPNGSPDGITALTSNDGRATIIMPHPERAFMSRQLSWHPKDWQTYSPWMQMFINAKEWVDNNS